ncbi:hypothetical protein FHS27_003682 [Rhodopirellula rubra]|uniref:Uncharacterized protein n=1 Tax=Aporhodopirellula rubra TaxID=980271 RepID=A0A7W5E0H1_9BACT|nr:sulfur globule family protein [Aporhodopirellula rubra]MBB3207855.1 hypothetical protein [Aporhodopirellula rubra]
MKRLLGSIVASLIVIAIASATPADAQTYRSSVHRSSNDYGYNAYRQPAPPSSCQRSGRSLALAAQQYHDAVAHFSEETHRSRSVDSFTLRLIDRLDSQAATVERSASRANGMSRIIYEFNEIESLQPQVEAAVFGVGSPVARSAFGDCWNEVRVAFAALSREMQQLRAPAYGSNYGSTFEHGHGYSNYPSPPVGYRSRGYESGYRAPTPAPIVAPPVSYPVHPAPRAPRNRSDLGNTILGGLLSRVVRGF